MQSQLPGRDPAAIPARDGQVLPQTLKAPEMPTFYSDRCDVEMAPWGATLVFMESVPLGQGAVRPTAAVRMSLEHLKVIAMLSHKILKHYEDTRLGGKRIVIPADTLRQIQLEGEQW